ncbi:uncharacterized protein LOC107647371 [Arachis ipaensis]|uniref:uncharacterized protein LOC107647371 n=1 Tax=Arachis ipaensis TaxID=130454 RepID=UPI0007AFB2FA|nr:uncharacterized protein LOC107647371 [Arachis ipaensis]
MATRARGRACSRESRDEQPADNHAEFMVAMANLVNTMEANAAATLQAFVEHVVYQLVGEAQQWWQGERRLLHQQNMNITWALLAFYKKYFESIKEARELDFLQLKQGFMTIDEYNSKFGELYKFSRISQGAPESYEGWKCVKYEVGLKEDIRRVVAPLKIRRFSELVDNARVVEEYAKTVASSRDTHGGNTSTEHTDYPGPRG